MNSHGGPSPYHLTKLKSLLCFEPSSSEAPARSHRKKWLGKSQTVKFFDKNIAGSSSKDTTITLYPNSSSSNTNDVILSSLYNNHDNENNNISNSCYFDDPPYTAKRISTNSSNLDNNNNFQFSNTLLSKPSSTQNIVKLLPFVNDSGAYFSQSSTTMDPLPFNLEGLIFPDDVAEEDLTECIDYTNDNNNHRLPLLYDDIKYTNPYIESNVINLLNEINQVLENNNNNNGDNQYTVAINSSMMLPSDDGPVHKNLTDSSKLSIIIGDCNYGDGDKNISTSMYDKVNLNNQNNKYHYKSTNPPKKSHSLSYPHQTTRRLAIIPDETEETDVPKGFHMFSPFYANWQKNCEAITYYRRRNSFPFYLGIDPSSDDSTNVIQGGSSNERIERSTRWSFFNLFERSAERRNKTANYSEFEEFLTTLNVKEIVVNEKFGKYMNMHWSTYWPRDCMKNMIEEPNLANNPIKQFKDACWELFTTECDFYHKTLMVLKNIYMEPLKELQVEGLLMDAELEILFGNLDEICAVTYEFCSDIISDIEETQFEPETLLTKLRSYNQDPDLGKNLKNSAYHKYCLNYLNSLNHLYILRYFNEFSLYEKWCKNQEMSKKRSLSDLLISPVQHFMKIPLIYKNILKRALKVFPPSLTDDDNLKGMETVINELDKSLQTLEEKMKWMKNYKRLQEIDNLLIWPTNKSHISKSNNIFYEITRKRLNSSIRPLSIANPRRRIVHEGNLIMIDNQSKSLEVRLFLFEDVIIITKMIKCSSSKKEIASGKKNIGNVSGFEVINQFIDTKRFLIDDITTYEESVLGVRNIFIINQLTKFNEIVATYLFQSDNAEIKKEWILKFKSLHQRSYPLNVSSI